MAYLEELLPEFRKGAKIRLKEWGKGEYMQIDYVKDENGAVFDFSNSFIVSKNWELYKEPEPDWQKIIDNKCLCWFWDDYFASAAIGLLKRIDEKFELSFVWSDESGNTAQFKNCRPIRRDEVTFYEDKEDEI